MQHSCALGVPLVPIKDRTRISTIKSVRLHCQAICCWPLWLTWFLSGVLERFIDTKYRCGYIVFIWGVDAVFSIDVCFLNGWSACYCCWLTARSVIDHACLVSNCGGSISAHFIDWTITLKHLPFNLFFAASHRVPGQSCIPPETEENQFMGVSCIWIRGEICFSVILSTAIPVYRSQEMLGELHRRIVATWEVVGLSLD